MRDGRFPLRLGYLLPLLDDLDGQGLPGVLGVLGSLCGGGGGALLKQDHRVLQLGLHLCELRLSIGQGRLSLVGSYRVPLTGGSRLIEFGCESGYLSGSRLTHRLQLAGPGAVLGAEINQLRCELVSSGHRFLSGPIGLCALLFRRPAGLFGTGGPGRGVGDTP